MNTKAEGPPSSFLPWLLIALTPVIFVLTTWDPMGESILVAYVRAYGLPVLAVEIGVIAYAVLAGFRPLQALKSAPRWSVAVLTLLSAIAVGTALFAAPVPMIAQLRTIFWFVHLLFGLSVYAMAAQSSERVLESFWIVVITCLVGFAALLAIFIVSIPDQARFDWLLLGFGGTNVRQLGFYSTVGAGVGLALAACANRVRTSALSAAAATLMFAVAFWSGTRGVAVAVWAAIGTGMLWLPQLRSFRAIALLAGATAAGAVLSLFHQAPNAHYGIGRIGGSLTAQTAEDVGSGRLSIWSGTWRAILERPLFGYGESQFRAVVPEAMQTFNHPHNAVLQLLLQWGFVGGACVVVLAAILIVRGMCVARNGGTSHTVAYAVLASLLAMALFEGTLYHAYPIAMLAAALALLNAPSPPRVRSPA